MSHPYDGRRLSMFDRWLQPIEDGMNYMAGLAIFALMLLGVAQIVLRKFFNAPIVGYIDLVELSMATFAFLGAAYCQRLGDHIRMEMLVGKLRGRALWCAEFTATLAALLIVSVLVWFGWEHFLCSYLLGYIVLGMFMEAIGMLLLTLPIVYPAVIALGFDLIWFGIIVVKMTEVCLITPTIGLNCFVVNGVQPDIPLTDVFRGIALFFIADVITLGVLIAFPDIIFWLPRTLM